MKFVSFYQILHKISDKIADEKNENLIICLFYLVKCFHFGFWAYEPNVLELIRFFKMWPLLLRKQTNLNEFRTRFFDLTGIKCALFVPEFFFLATDLYLLTANNRFPNQFHFYMESFLLSMWKKNSLKRLRITNVYIFESKSRIHQLDKLLFLYIKQKQASKKNENDPNVVDLQFN